MLFVQDVELIKMLAGKALRYIFDSTSIISWYLYPSSHNLRNLLYCYYKISLALYPFHRGYVKGTLKIYVVGNSKKGLALSLFSRSVKI